MAEDKDDIEVGQTATPDDPEAIGIGPEDVLLQASPGEESGADGTGQEPDRAEEPVVEAEEEPQETEQDQDWDQERQKRDQKLAVAEKKAKQLEAELAEANRAKPTVQTSKEPEEVSDVEELDLGEFPEDDPQAVALNKLIQKDRARDRREAARDNKQAFNDLLDEACAKYGKQYRNPAVERLAEIWAEDGFDQNNFPSPAVTKVAVDGVFIQLAHAKPKEKAKTKPKAPAQDTGRGGQAVPLRSMKGVDLNITVEEAFEEIQAEGKPIA